MLTTRHMNSKNRFKREDKVQLIAAVKARRLLWDIRDNEHNDLISIKAAWKSVAFDLGRDRKFSVFLKNSNLIRAPFHLK